MWLKGLIPSNTVTKCCHKLFINRAPTAVFGLPRGALNRGTPCTDPFALQNFSGDHLPAPPALEPISWVCPLRTPSPLGRSCSSGCRCKEEFQGCCWLLRPSPRLKTPRWCPHTPIHSVPVKFWAGADRRFV